MEYNLKFSTKEDFIRIMTILDNLDGVQENNKSLLDDNFIQQWSSEKIYQYDVFNPKHTMKKLQHETEDIGPAFFVKIKKDEDMKWHNILKTIDQSYTINNRGHVVDLKDSCDNIIQDINININTLKTNGMSTNEILKRINL